MHFSATPLVFNDNSELHMHNTEICPRLTKLHYSSPSITSFKPEALITGGMAALNESNSASNFAS